MKSKITVNLQETDTNFVMSDGINNVILSTSSRDELKVEYREEIGYKHE